MKIAENTVVGLTYELKVSKEADEIESAPFSVEVRDTEDPFYFLFGASDLPAKFEELLIGKERGEDFSFIVPVAEAYGEIDEDLIVTLPKSQFSGENGFNPEMLEEGNFLPLMDEDGYPMQAKILKDMGEDVLLDFNHPLVGFDLHFEGNIEEVREATEDELAHGHVHGAHGAHDEE
ncbi:FKBP-type peptidyl-prolyl cis-trans isomerase SlyD [Algoriphagus ratkowskyi]|uniref:peptidylprolyl isomerase n=1 Tax=Algoriphagus ratkowskyi TaxID=57028 RepID=A0A2W7SBY5_9BACT|nr:FKBP-type peptidyl-prolyl cis-trans isomerase [Algoriphagus ratkowskyi]PZX60375.1 FKBP-type peptidyl-prolyl cis-trans isomerase SlyD [Algoriphagus ratkowskyi]TXD78189.1 peptidylprolyl isomerase [Algoriphagus ratkowskyi]